MLHASLFSRVDDFKHGQENRPVSMIARRFIVEPQEIKRISKSRYQEFANNLGLFGSACRIDDKGTTRVTVQGPPDKYSFCQLLLARLSRVFSLIGWSISDSGFALALASRSTKMNKNPFSSDVPGFLL